MQKALTKKAVSKKPDHADSRELLAKFAKLIAEEGGTFEADIRAPKCSHAEITLKNGDRFRILVETR